MRFVHYVKTEVLSGSEINPFEGVLSEPLWLVPDPTNPLEAVTKNYAENAHYPLDITKLNGVLSTARLPPSVGENLESSGGGLVYYKDFGPGENSYGRVSVNAKGMVTDGGVLQEQDIPILTWGHLQNTPNSLVGYGIEDAVSLTNGVFTGPVSLAPTPLYSDVLVTKAYIDNRFSQLEVVDYSVGDILFKSGDRQIEGFLRCNGGVVSEGQYPQLYQTLGPSYMVDPAVEGGDEDGELEESFLPGRETYPISRGQPWSNLQETDHGQTTVLGSWSFVKSLPANFGAHKVFVTHKKVYFVGKIGYTLALYMAPINLDGSLGDLVSQPIPLSIDYLGAVFVTYNRVYILGGGSMEYQGGTAFVHPDGSLGPWSYYTDPEYYGSGHRGQVFVTNNRMYLLGAYGENGVWESVIGANGKMVEWVAYDGPGNEDYLTISAAGIVKTHSYVYFFGGSEYANRPTPYNYRAQYLYDDIIGPWELLDPLPFRRQGMKTITTNDRVYTFGGINFEDVPPEACYTCPINSEGELGVWEETTSLPTGLEVADVFVTKGHAYIVSYDGEIYTAPINTGYNSYLPFYSTSPEGDQWRDNRTLMFGNPWKDLSRLDLTTNTIADSWTMANSLPANYENYTNFVTKDWVYFIGRVSSVPSAFRAPIDANGNIGTFETVSPPNWLNRKVYAVTTRDRVYIMGEAEPGCEGQTAQIYEDGDLGSWENFIDPMTAGLYIRGFLGRSICSHSTLYHHFKKDSQNYRRFYQWTINNDGTLGESLIPNNVDEDDTSTIVRKVGTEKGIFHFVGNDAANPSENVSYFIAYTEGGVLDEQEWLGVGTIPFQPRDHYHTLVTKEAIFFICSKDVVSGQPPGISYRLNLDANGVYTNCVPMPVSGALQAKEFEVSDVFAVKGKLYAVGNTHLYFMQTGVGVNDCSPFYHHPPVAFETYLPGGTSTPLTFRLPNLNDSEMPGYYSYIKY